MKKICEYLKEQATKIINFQKKKKKMKSLTNGQQKLYENAKLCYICKEMFEDEYANNTKYRKVRDRYHYAGEQRGAAHSIYNLKYSISKKNSRSFSR